MLHPHASGAHSIAGVEAALLVPVKRFSAAKGRLGAHLSPAERARLARWLGERVIQAAGSMPAFVACDDDQVAEWADGLGATVLWSPDLGLNGAVDQGRATIAGKGFDHVVIAHSDLPLASELGRTVRAGAITLVPDRHLDGTNVMALPTMAVLPASYGAGSFRRHQAAADASGLVVDVLYDPDLALDVDTRDDLVHPRIAAELPSWLPTSPASRR
jgi:2-phospho-L-lactate guanylyltransferase